MNKIKNYVIVFLVSVTGFFCASKSTGNEFVYRVSSSPVTLDPALSVDASSNAIISELYDGLVEINPKDGKIVPCIAESWKVSKDGMTWIFKIKNGIKFHNNKTVNAYDVKYSLERILKPSTRCPRTWVLEPIKGAKEFMAGESNTVAGINIIDSLTVKISLKEPFAPFISHLAMTIASIVPNGSNDLRNKPCGTGPFELERYVRDVEIVLSSFDKYYGKRASIKKVVFRVVPNDIVAYEQYKAGEIDFLNPVPSGLVISVRKKFPNEFHKWPIMELRYLGMNMDKQIFKEHPGLRKAISLAVDRKGIAKIIYEDVVAPTCNIIPPGLRGYVLDTTCYRRNLKLAKEYLKKEGFENGDGLPELTLLYNSKEVESRLWQFVKANLEEAGFKIKLKSLEWGTFLSAVRKGECDLFRGSWVADYPDAHNFMYILFNSKNCGAAGNYSRYNNKEYDKISEQAKVLSDNNKREKMYLKLQKIIKNDMPVCPLFFGGDAILLKEKWKGFIPSVQGAWAVPLNYLHSAGDKS